MPPTYKRRKPTRLQAVADPDLNLPALTVKQETFVNHILAGKTAREAYRLAFNCSKMNEGSIAVQSSKTLRDPQIAQSIRSRQRIGLEEAAITQANHLAELARLRELAVENTQISAGVQAEHYRGRVAGLYNDKLTLQVGPTDQVLLAQIASLLGNDMAQALGNAIGIEGEAVEIEPREASKLLSAPSAIEK